MVSSAYAVREILSHQSLASIATVGIAVSKALSTAPDSTTGKLGQNSFFVALQAGVLSTVSLPDFGLN